MKKLLETHSLAGRELSNRITMAPMTRARRPDYIANEETAVYYRQRASAGPGNLVGRAGPGLEAGDGCRP